MSGITLDYGIEDKKKIVVSEGTLETLSQKNSYGFYVDGIADKFEMTLKLKQPSIVFMIEFSSLFTPKVIFELLNTQGKILESVICNFEPNAKQLIPFPKSRDNKLATSKVRITICNVQGLKNPIMVGIKYLLVRGEKIEPSKASKRDISKKPELAEPRLSPHSFITKTKDTGALFSDRKKNKEKEKPEVSEDSLNLMKAIEMSKKDAQKKEETTSHINNQKGSIWMQQKEERARDYDLVDFDKVKHIFAHVNSKWIEAQRKMEIERGVKENERLSKHILSLRGDPKKI